MIVNLDNVGERESSLGGVAQPKLKVLILILEEMIAISSLQNVCVWLLLLKECVEQVWCLLDFFRV